MWTHCAKSSLLQSYLGRKCLNCTKSLIITTVLEGSTSVNRTAVTPPGLFTYWNTECAGTVQAQVNAPRLP